MTIGRFQPFTQGHLNMVNEGDAPCIVYRINSTNKMPTSLGALKVQNRKVKKESIEKVIQYINDPTGDLTEQEKELLKRPFTNELINKELDIIKRNNKNIIAVVPVINAYDALFRFNAFITEHPEYEPQYWMCGDDRVDRFSEMIGKYDELPTELNGSKKLPNILDGRLTTNIGKGRTKGVSGTAVRASIISKDKAAFSNIMPRGVDGMFDDFVNAFEEFKGILAGLIKESKLNLAEFIKENLTPLVLINEGGAGGHMAHPFDYTDFTADDLICLVNDIFGGKVEHMKEKLDGFNINATMNNNGEVVFVRNNTERNSERGGITVDDMYKKWEGKDRQTLVYTTSGKVIEQIFQKLGSKYFNPDPTHRKIVNCECIVAGQTNIMPYAADRVAFHGYKLYELRDGKWVEVDSVEGDVDAIYKAAEGIDQAKPRPDLVIRSAEDAANFAKKFEQEITNLWRNEGLSTDTSIEEWKWHRYQELAPEWCRGDRDIFNRICNDDKSVKATELKKRYPEQKTEIMKLDKQIKKDVVGAILEPLDELFLEIGNELIDLLDGFVNSGSKDSVTQTIKKDMEELVKTVAKSDSDVAKDKIERSMRRLQKLGDKYNAAEGVVIVYKGRLMKLTGSFAPINQALGARFDLE